MLLTQRDLSGLDLWVVEDHASAAEALVEIAQSLGASATAFSSAEAALDHGGPPPSVVITDLHLPGMNGVALLEQLRTRVPRPEVIVITAHGSATEAMRALQLGAVDFLTKPLNVHRIEAVLRRAKARRHADAIPPKKTTGEEE